MSRNPPPPRYRSIELASEPWYSVSAGDVFRQEFRTGCAPTRALGHCLKRCMPHLLRADYLARTARCGCKTPS
ncbi:bifunctional isocitrate dehydrogenase kinase/phosphatase [Klebsiella pneumoniae]|nr:bifunctional isocitrate dehydrogenase kinase/phosphatase [Klebsiella pneumoniae]